MMERISPHGAWEPSDADFEKTNRQAEVAKTVARQLRGLPWNFDGSIRIMYKEGYEPEIVIDNISPQEAVVLLSRACSAIMAKHDPHKEITSYPDELFADIASADKWGFEEL